MGLHTHEITPSWSSSIAHPLDDEDDELVALVEADEDEDEEDAPLDDVVPGWSRKPS
jgi:hypothetical protein